MERMQLADARSGLALREAVFLARDQRLTTEIIEDGVVIAVIGPAQSAEPGQAARDQAPDAIEQGIAAASRLNAQLGLELTRVRDLVAQQRR
jgi:hypothetical protein